MAAASLPATAAEVGPLLSTVTPRIFMWGLWARMRSWTATWATSSCPIISNQVVLNGMPYSAAADVRALHRCCKPKSRPPHYIGIPLQATAALPLSH